MFLQSAFRAGARPGRAASCRSGRIGRVPAAVRRQQHARRQVVQVQAVFGLFSPKANAATGSPKAAELVDELLTLVGNGKAPAAEVSELVSKLQPLSVKSPVRSKLLFGAYELVYSSKPLSGSRQILEEPDQIKEVSESKALGLLPSTTTLTGELNGISNDTYEEAYDTLETKAAIGGETRAVDVVREVQVLYLDNTLRVVRIKGEKEGPDGTLAVYTRITDDGDDDDDDNEPAPGPRPLFGGAREGTATIVERQLRQKMANEQSKPGTQARRVASPPPAARGGTTSLRPGTQSNRPGTVKAGSSAIDKRKEADAAAAKAKEAKEAALAKERAEAEKRAAAERQSAIKALLEDLSGDLKEAQQDARDAAKEAKDLERENGVALKQVASARVQLKAAADGVSAVEQDIAKAAEARAAAEAAVKQALAEFNNAQAKVKAAAGRK